MAVITLDIRSFGYEPGDRVVFEVAGTVTRVGADSVAIEVDSTTVKTMPRNLREAAKHAYVTLRQEQSVG